MKNDSSHNNETVLGYAIICISCISGLLIGLFFYRSKPFLGAFFGAIVGTTISTIIFHFWQIQKNKQLEDNDNNIDSPQLFEEIEASFIDSPPQSSNDSFDIFYDNKLFDNNVFNTPSDSNFDPMIFIAIETVVECQAASTTLLQRKLRLGYARAALIMDELEQYHVVGPANGSSPRKVLMTKEQLQEIRFSNGFASYFSKRTDPSFMQIKDAIQGGEFYNDSLLRSAIRYVVEVGVASSISLQNKFHLTSLQAEQLLRDLEYLKIIALPNEFGTQKVLLKECNLPELFDLLGQAIVDEEFKDRRKSFEYTVQNNMSGYEFEIYCGELLRKNGYENINQTKLSGDNGIDILAEKDGIKYAIQCKCYSSPVGNKAVQEAFTGAQIYHCDIAVVMTNSTFTPQAIHTAEETRVRLWDGKKLEEMMAQ